MRILVQGPAGWTEVPLEPGTSISIQPRVGKEVFVEVREDGSLSMSVIQAPHGTGATILPLRPK